MYKSASNKKGSKKQKSPCLFDQIQSTFSCTGVLDRPHKFSIFCKYGSGKCQILDFPSPASSSIETIVANSKVSGFGKGHENVVDKSYRKAHEVLPDNLGINPKLQELITQSVCPLVSSVLNRNNVRAELIKLNIYSEGGLFKQHVDSPKQDAFGSLVVFLPSPHDGGALVVKHKDATARYFYGDRKQVHWVAFYNDCIHEIEEVKKGYRLTLSYNLFSEPNPKSIESIYPNQDVSAVLLTLEEKRLYGYYCEHYYGNNSLKNIADNPLSVLKGLDAQVWVACQKLGLKADIKVIFRDIIRDEEGEETIRFFAGNPETIETIASGVVNNQQYGDEEYFRQRFPRDYKATPFEHDQVLWVNSQTGGEKYVFAIDGYYGNDYSMNENYCQLVMAIDLR